MVEVSMTARDAHVQHLTRSCLWCKIIHSCIMWRHITTSCRMQLYSTSADHVITSAHASQSELMCGL